MTTNNFQSRLDRIQKSHAQAPAPKAVGVREPGVAAIAASHRMPRNKRRHPVMEHLFATGIGGILGCLIAVALIGLSMDTSPWGPGTPWYGMVYYPTMAGLALAPLLMLVSMMVAARRPGFALFSLGYLSGIVLPLII